MSRTFDTLGSDTVDVIFDNLAFQAYGNCRERSSSPFRDYADRDLGSPRFLRMHYLLACRVKFPVEQGLGHQAGSASRTSLASYARWSTRQKLELRILN